MTSHSVPDDYVAGLPLSELLSGLEAWAIMSASETFIPYGDIVAWRGAYRREIIRRCAEQNFEDGRAL